MIRVIKILKSFLGIIEYISKETFMPITIGGKIKIFNRY
jgi:hypothetical protein